MNREDKLLIILVLSELLVLASLAPLYLWRGAAFVMAVTAYSFGLISMVIVMMKFQKEKESKT